MGDNRDAWTCRQCGRPMRTKKTPLAEAPGTIVHAAHQLCGTCYVTRQITISPECVVIDCDGPGHRRGLCNKHYKRWWKSGNTEQPAKRWSQGTDPQIWERLIENDKRCWIWQGSTNPQGYGTVTIEKTSWYVHRLVYTIIVGEIPDGLELDHLCRNTSCANPWHLEPVTPRVNGLRSESPSALNARKSQCIHGHEFTPDNTYLTPTGRRQCRTCAQERSLQRRRVA